MSDPEYIDGHAAQLDLTPEDVEPDEVPDGGDSDA
jgi:hypothetical protein